MYQENGGFDQSSNMHGSDESFSQSNLPNCNFSMDDQPYPQNDAVSAAAALEMELHHHLDIDHCYATKNGPENWQQDISAAAAFNAAENAQFHHQNPTADFNQIYSNTASMADAAAAAANYPNAPDLLNIFPLPRCSPSPLLPNFPHKSPAFMASLGLLGDHINQTNDVSAASNGVVYDPLLPLNLPPQPPLLRELFHSYSRNVGGGGGGGLFTTGILDERDGNVGLYQNGDVYEFTGADLSKNRDGSKDTKHFATEKHRRVLLNDKYKALGSLVPCPTKNDRASVVGDAIKYINELKRTVTELKALVEKKRCVRERLKRPKMEENGSEIKCEVGDMTMDGSSSSLRSSWLHRKTKNTEVDVRIIDDEVTVKLVQQKRINCLLFVSKVLDELQLDLHHVAGGLIGDYYSYLFNSKIGEGSMVYASAVANKLIEVVDKQYAAVPPATNY